MAILTSGKIEYKTKKIITDREGRFMIQESIYMEAIHVHTPKSRVPKYTSQIQTKLERKTDSPTIIGDFNTPFS